MKLSDFFAKLDKYAPLRLSADYCEKYGAYDNSGILYDSGEEITGAVFSLDLTAEAIEKAKAEKANLIVTHHPAQYGKSDKINKKVALAIKEGISLVGMHLNLDCAEDGIDSSLAQAVKVATGGGKKETLMDPLSPSEGYGRVYEVKKTVLSAFVSALSEEMNVSRVRVFGDGNEPIGKVASFCGGGTDEKSVAFAIEQGADAFVSSDFKHHLITALLEAGVAVVDITHYASENYGFKKYYEKISRSCSVPCYFCERDMK